MCVEGKVLRSGSRDNRQGKSFGRFRGVTSKGSFEENRREEKKINLSIVSGSP